MGRSRDGGSGSREEGSPRAAAAALPVPMSFPSPASSSSSDFEFTVSLSPASKRTAAAQLCPADELFYKGQLLPLHLSPRISMVRSLLLASTSTSSASGDSTTTGSRDSNGSTSSSFSADLNLLNPTDSASSSARPSSATDDDAPGRRAGVGALPPKPQRQNNYFSSLANRFSSVFLPRGNSKKESKDHSLPKTKLPSSSPKEMLKKYVKKVKPLYEKLSSLNNNNHNQSSAQKKNFSFSIRKEISSSKPENHGQKRDFSDHHSSSFSGNLKYPRRKRCAASCPSSMRSSPSHSGLLCIGGAGAGAFPDLPPVGPVSLSTASSMEELQSAIEGAIAHCKSSMVQTVTFAGQKKVAIAGGGGGSCDEVYLC